MLHVELELPKISAGTIAELRIPENLTRLHDAAEFTSPATARLHTLISVVLRQHVSCDADKSAIDIGVTIAESLNFLHLQKKQVTIDEAAVKETASIFNQQLVDESYHEGSVQRAVGKMDHAGFETFRAFERIAAPYVDGEDGRLELAMRGAAVLHCAMNDSAQLELAEVHELPVRG